MKKLAKISLMLAAVCLLSVSKIYAQISVGVTIQANIAPPVLVTYAQPPCPTDGYLWQPGYWAWDPDSQDYYWVPGVWIAPPQPGLLWTPSYWGYANGAYVYHGGYWGPHVGFYGGINYGGGFFGVGFAGGAWSGGHFRYNTAAVNVNTTVIHNTYVNKTVIVNNTIVNNHVSYNGGGGVSARPRPEELQAEHDQHVQPTGAQLAHQQAAAKDPNQFSKNNNGKPAISTMAKPNPQRFAQDKANAKPGNANHNATNPQNKRAANGSNTAHNKPAANGNNPQPNKPANNGNLKAHNSAPRNKQQHGQQPKQQHAQQPKQQHAQPRTNKGDEGKKHE